MSTGRIVVSLTVALCAASTAASPAALTLPDGTPIRLRLERTLTVNNYQPGDPVDFAVADEVRIDGFLVIARGTRAAGVITAGEPKTRMRKIWKLGVSLAGVPLMDGGQAPVRAAKARVEAPGAAADPGTVARPGSPSAIFSFGKADVLPEGTLIAVYADGDVRLDAAKFLFDIAFTSNPTGALVTMYGAPVGRTPFTTRLAQGTYTAIFSVDGFYDLTQTINVGPGYANTAHAAFELK
ncbi:MAG TPA: PEGA domain-containing protein [Bryobacteraceae bacterium]|jgi:hypothetical protein|nr:PEGA domain-containing protein [Bryobacteraceae bacterium]